MNIDVLKTFCCAVLLASGAAQAADAVRGAQVYMRTDNDGRSCVTCHGPDPGTNHNNILRAADQPETLTRVLDTVSAIGFLRSLLSDADRADVSAFLGSMVRLNATGAGLLMWPVTIDFGATPVNGVSAAQTVRFTNASNAMSLPLTSISSSQPQVELAGACPPMLAPGGVSEVQARHKPMAPGRARTAIKVASPAFGAPTYVAAAGSGALGPLSQLVWQPDAAAVVRFNAASNPPLLRQVVALANRGPMPAVLGLASIVGPDAGRFRIESGCAAAAQRPGKPRFNPAGRSCHRHRSATGCDRSGRSGRLGRRLHGRPARPACCRSIVAAACVARGLVPGATASMQTTDTSPVRNASAITSAADESGTTA